MVSAYLEGEDVFKEVCRQYCDQLLPQQNTLALILPLILGNSKTSLQDMNLQGWSRMLSGLLAIVPKEAATALITELGASLQAQHRIIPAQICAILCGRELQSFTANPAFSLLGGEVVEKDLVEVMKIKKALWLLASRLQRSMSMVYRYRMECIDRVH